MKDLLFDHFQDSVDEILIRHKSILDVLTKFQESQTRANRAVVKAVTACGCIEINSKKQNFSDEISLDELKDFLDTHVKGNLCDNCRDVIEKELGNNLFYMAALCNLLDISMYDVMIKEYEQIKTLGVFNMT